MSRYKVTMIDAKNAEIPISKGADFVYITGTPAISTGWALTVDDTPSIGHTITIQYCAVPTFTSGHVVILGTTLDDVMATKKLNIAATYNGSAWKVTILPSFDEEGFLKPNHFAAVGKAFLLIGNHDGDMKALDISGLLDIDGSDNITIKAGAIKLVDIASDITIPIGYIVGPTKGKFIKSNDATGILEEVDITVTLPDALTDLTAGTATAEKAVVLDHNGQVAGLDLTSPKIGGVSVEVGAAILNLLENITTDQMALLKYMETAGIVTADIDNLVGIRP